MPDMYGRELKFQEVLLQEVMPQSSCRLQNGIRPALVIPAFAGMTKGKTGQKFTSLPPAQKPQAQGIQLDKPFGVFLIIDTVGLKRHMLHGIEALW